MLDGFCLQTEDTGVALGQGRSSTLQSGLQVALEVKIQHLARTI